MIPERLRFVILLRITDSPIYAAECRHNVDCCWYSCEYEVERRDEREMILVSICSAKGEGKVGRESESWRRWDI